MLVKDAKFKWLERQENSYKALLSMLNDKTCLRPFRPELPTHFISDASRCGIAASVYQEERDGTFVPVDHVDRALSTTEQGWESQLEWESLAKSWGMNMLRTYLVGKKFTSWGDHLPLVPLYNNPAIAAGRRVPKHRQHIKNLSMKE